MHTCNAYIYIYEKIVTKLITDQQRTHLASYRNFVLFFFFVE